MEAPTKGIVIISNVTKALEHEWFVEYVDRSRFQIEFILFNSRNSPLMEYIRAQGFACENHELKSKLGIPGYIMVLAAKMARARPDFVHCHLLEAGLIGLPAALLAGVKKRVYTRHHSDFHHVYHSHGVWYDKFINRIATHIIAISTVVKKVLVEMEKTPEAKVTVIPHGIPARLMGKTPAETNVLTLRRKYGLEGRFPVIGCVSRFTHWKGVHHIVSAFAKLRQRYPGALLVLANAQGEYEAKILELLKPLPPSSFILIKFEPDSPSLFAAFDVFVHAPVTLLAEAFGQVYLEAMNAGTPTVCTISGIAAELVEDGQNALVAKYSDPGSLAEKIIAVLEDSHLRSELKRNAPGSVRRFSFENKISAIQKIYGRG